ncbi:MAG: glycosyltransferase family 4 protein [Deltaproteobacteria bacterium]|nr:glycosyltransferase family 4 protein [Deltaproteobacteria bacterium]
MKIVFLAPFGIRPKGTVIARMLPLASELQILGHEVTVIVPPYTNPEDSGITEIVQGVRLVNVLLPSGGKAMGALQLAWRMFRSARAEKADLVHLFKPKGYGGLAAMLHLSLQRLGLRLPPLFLDSDDWEGKGGMNDLHSYSTLEKWLFAFQEGWLSKRAVGVSVASRELQRLTTQAGVAPERICYLPNCVSEITPGDGRHVREKFGIRPEVPVLLLYTRFFEFDQERLYRIFAGILSGVSGVRFLVVGKGRNREEERLTAAARKMGFDAALIMAGWIAPQEIPDYLAAASVAIYPMDDTLVNRSKCPAKLTELLLAGLPVVADRVGQTAEYIVDTVSGILCSPGDTEQMVDRTVWLLQEPEANRKLASEGRRSLLERFNWREAAQNLDHFYRSLANP